MIHWIAIAIKNNNATPKSFSIKESIEIKSLFNSAIALQYYKDQFSL